MSDLTIVPMVYVRFDYSTYEEAYGLDYSDYRDYGHEDHGYEEAYGLDYGYEEDYSDEDHSYGHAYGYEEDYSSEDHGYEEGYSHEGSMVMTIGNDYSDVYSEVP